jgi:hypothetical protein
MFLNHKAAATATQTSAVALELKLPGNTFQVAGLDESSVPNGLQSTGWRVRKQNKYGTSPSQTKVSCDVEADFF